MATPGTLRRPTARRKAMNMRTAAADGAPEPCRCAPCNPGRMGAAVTPLLILAIVALNYIPSVLFALDMGVDAATVALVVVFPVSYTHLTLPTKRIV